MNTQHELRPDLRVRCECDLFHEDSLRIDSLAKKLLCKNDKEFWKEIRRMHSKVSLPNVIDGVCFTFCFGNVYDCVYGFK